MLEFLGFIALIAIIFGISFGAALAGFVKVIAIGICLIVALGIIAKMLSSKNGTLFVLVASAIALVLGIIMINDDYNKRYSYCAGMTNTQLYASCALNAMDGHNESVNKGWGYTIAGGIFGAISLGIYNSFSKNKSSKKR